MFFHSNKVRWTTVIKEKKKKRVKKEEYVLEFCLKDIERPRCSLQNLIKQIISDMDWFWNEIRTLYKLIISIKNLVEYTN